MLHHIRLISNRIILRSIEQRDLSALFDKLFGNKYAAWREWDGAENTSEKITFIRYLERMQSCLDSPSLERWLLIEVNQTLSGMVLYDWESRLTQTIEVGITIFESNMWNQGFGTEALAFWVDFLFHELWPMTICVTTKSTNHRMMRCAEKLGLERSGQPYAHQINGEERVRMAVSLDNWVKTRWCGISSTEIMDKPERKYEPHGSMWKV